MRRVAIGLLLVLVAVVPSEAGKTKTYTYTRVGNALDVSTPTTAGVVLMGGGTDVDTAFQWMCGRSGGGDFLIIRTTGTDAYNPYVKSLCPGLNSVATLIVPTVAGANDQFVATAMQQAEAIWIAGGDQSTYVANWQGTMLQAELNAAASQRQVPVGGTSAGMMVLTQFIYSALASQGVTSSQALANPYNKYMSFARDLAAVPNLENTIGDSHFVTRDRMGRTLAFMCRVAKDHWSVTPRAIAVDEETALEIDGRGKAVVVGNGAAYFLSAGAPAEVCDPNKPLTYQNVAVFKSAVGQSFDLGTWTGRTGLAYTVSAVAGVLTSFGPGGAIY
jgi:cyanophycinase